MVELSLVETLSVILIVSFVLIATGVAVIIILVVMFYKYKRVLKRQARERLEQQQQRRRQRSWEEVENDGILEPDIDHLEASTHGGEAPPGYEESKHYRSISVESLNQLNIEQYNHIFIKTISTEEEEIENDTGQTSYRDSSPPPYILYNYNTHDVS